MHIPTHVNGRAVLRWEETWVVSQANSALLLSLDGPAEMI